MNNGVWLCGLAAAACLIGFPVADSLCQRCCPERGLVGFLSYPLCSRSSSDRAHLGLSVCFSYKSAFMIRMSGLSVEQTLNALK